MRTLLYIAFIVAGIFISCNDEVITPALDVCRNVTVSERTADKIYFTIQSTEPQVTICNPYTGDCWVIKSDYYNCIQMSITTILVMDGECIIQ